ncbi:MAG TPA: DUF4148 domain-containing protein [Paraburkholderia sp.]|jgi:hypothetical protein|uniref:DUF4148 domain-containing protein n=1 Tax=Paraburkholderia sp. TaxID=1926495 RepID=UPI002DF40557|nr:DUF4148 domain-containing protein [Paraburkholderia sp.]
MTQAVSLAWGRNAVDAIEAAACIWIVSSGSRGAGRFICVAMYLRLHQIQGIAIKAACETRQIRAPVQMHQRRNLLGNELDRQPVVFFSIYRFKENIMQVSKIALALVAGAALVAASASFAAVPASSDTAAQTPTQTWTPTQQNANTKITRAQVRQELVDAEHNGQLDALRSLYRGS